MGGGGGEGRFAGTQLGISWRARTGEERVGKRTIWLTVRCQIGLPPLWDGVKNWWRDIDC